MDAVAPLPRRRGRPPKLREDTIDTRDLLLRAGLEVLTAKGFSSTGIDEVLRRVGVPKGSFYHYFESKEAFGAELVDRYAAYFAKKLDRHLLNETLPPLARISAFIADAQAGMERYGFSRGCLIGNFGQEMGALPEGFRIKLQNVFDDWQCRLARCLAAAQAAGALSKQADCQELAKFFWIGWEGAVLRAKLELDAQPLKTFAHYFFTAILPR